MSANGVEKIKEEYDKNKKNYEQLCNTIIEQLSELIEKYNIKLAVPIDGRVKTWQSVFEKVDRKKKGQLSEITDLAGIRVITIFREDIKKLIDIIEGNFFVLKKEDTSSRLEDNQFGYGSIHFEVTLKDEWCNIPTFMGLKNLTAEIQVRTTSQHMWASASHVLQYKNEKSTPVKVRRSINRVAALLELVDLEFERVLIEREMYINSIKDETDISELNIDNLKYILDTLLPKENLGDSEDYSRLIGDLRKFEIYDTEKLRELVSKNLEETLKADKRRVREELSNKSLASDNPERLKRGVFFTHVGLLRQVLRIEFGDEEVTKRLFNEAS